MDAKKKSEWRDAVALISVGLLSRPAKQDYSYAVGCWLNLDRIHNRQVANIVSAIYAALSKDDIDLDVVDAMVDDEELVEEVADAINAKRQHAAVLAKRGMFQ